MRHKLARLWHWIGLLSGILGLVILINLVDAHAVASALTEANPLPLLLAALLVLLAVALRSWRWVFFFQQLGLSIPLRRMLSVSLMSSFYDQFVPASSALGATLIFAETDRSGGSTVDFIAVAIVERLANLISLFVGASLVLLLAHPVALPSGLSGTIYLAAIALVGSLLILRHGAGLERIGRWLGHPRLHRLSRSAITLSHALQGDLGRWPVIGRGITLSVLVNACVMTTSYLATLAVAGPVPIFSFMAMAALIVALQGIPITPGSLGVRESLYIFFLRYLGISEARALTVGLLVMTLNWFQGFIGGGVVLQRSLSGMGRQRKLDGGQRTKEA